MTLKGHDRKHFMVVPLDGPFRVKDMAPSIQALKKAAAGSNGAVGVGLLSMMGFEHTRNELSVSLPTLWRLWTGSALLGDALHWGRSALGMPCTGNAVHQICSGCLQVSCGNACFATGTVMLFNGAARVEA